MIKKAFAAAVLAGMAISAQAGIVLNEDFENVSTLSSQGWIFANASTPGGLTPGWFQGDQTQFAAQSGNPYSYAAANYNAAPSGGDLDAWLITPVFNATHGANVSFYLRAAGGGYVDQINFGFVNADGSLTSLGLTAVNPVPDSAWVQYTAMVGADQLGNFTRFAFRYTGPADAANYVGLDSLVVDVPEPASLALIAGGLLGLRAARRRQRG